MQPRCRLHIAVQASGCIQPFAGAGPTKGNTLSPRAPEAALRRKAEAAEPPVALVPSPPWGHDTDVQYHAWMLRSGQGQPLLTYAKHPHPWSPTEGRQEACCQSCQTKSLHCPGRSGLEFPTRGYRLRAIVERFQEHSTSTGESMSALLLNRKGLFTQHKLSETDPLGTS